MGQCQMCGESFIGAVLFGETIKTGIVPACDSVLAVHAECAKLLDGRPWEDLPDGPIRRVYEDANREVPA